MRNKIYDIIREYIIIAVLILFFILGCLYVYKQFFPNKDNVTLEIVGITDSINATTLTSLHLECIKFCARRDYARDCWKHCATLGKEEFCKNGKEN